MLVRIPIAMAYLMRWIVEEKMERKALKARRELREHKVQRELLGPLEHKAQRDHKERLGQLAVPLEPKAHKVQLVQLVQLAQLVHRVQLELMEQMELRVHKVQRVHKETLVIQEHKALRDLLTYHP